MSMILVYIATKDNNEAKKIAKHLINKKLVACVNIFPIESLYYWDKKLMDDKECVLILKSINKNYKKIEFEIKQMHSYKIPCILKIKVDANKEYGKWVEENVNC